jgi:hypothetical protein
MQVGEIHRVSDAVKIFIDEVAIVMIVNIFVVIFL